MADPQPPPPWEDNKTYHKGDKVGYGSVADFNYPYGVIQRDYTRTLYVPATPTSPAVYNEPIEGYDIISVYPAWSSKVNYINQDFKPWGGWKVWYNNILYEPSFWLGSANYGQPPSVAKVLPGATAGNIDKYYAINNPDFHPFNQTDAPIRGWLPSSYNSHYNDAWVYDPPMKFMVALCLSTSRTGLETVEYAPDFSFLREYEVYTPNPVGQPNRQDVRPILDWDGRPEPIGWDVNTGRISEKDVYQGSPYDIYFYARATYGGSRYGYGYSMNLFYQKVKTTIPSSYTIDSVNTYQPQTAEITPSASEIANTVFLVDQEPYPADYTYSYLPLLSVPNGMIVNQFTSPVITTSGDAQSGYTITTTTDYDWTWVTPFHPMFYTRGFTFYAVTSIVEYNNSTTPPYTTTTNYKINPRLQVGSYSGIGFDQWGGNSVVLGHLTEVDIQYSIPLSGYARTETRDVIYPNTVKYEGD